MRLICGLFQLDGSDAAEERLRAMIAQLDVPRLHPAITVWCEGPVGLAVLDFTARSASPPTLPMQGASIMAADVRLDEPAVLGRSEGMAANTREDALLQSVLEHHGPSGLDRVLGDFAFAAWNRSAQRLTCGRDVFGVRPFAYVHKPQNLFAFASFPKALHGSGIVPKTVDQEALARRLTLGFRADDSLVAGIHRLPAAHTLEVSRNGLTLTRYWQPDRAAVGTRKCSPQDAAAEMRRLIDEAVGCRLPHGAQIGAHLSGGLDSSAIAVLAARKLREDGRTLHAYSFLDRPRNDIALEDETEFVKAVVEQESDMDWTAIRPSAALPSRDAPLDADKIVLLGEDHPESAVCTRAEQQGVNVILSGWGGDEAATFNGRGAFAELFLRGRWQTLAREMRALRRERRWSWPRVLYGEVVSYLLPPTIVAFARRLSGKDAALRSQLALVLTPALRQHLAEEKSDDDIVLVADGRENRWRLMMHGHIAERAEVWAQTGARNGVTFAFPLLDRRVVEFALSLPSELFLRDGFRRRPFRDAMAGVLPEKVRLRHHKYQPFPGRMLDIVDNKDDLLAQIDGYARNETVRRVIDLDVLRRHIESLPSPAVVREQMRGGDNPAAAAAMLVAMQGLAAANYLEQHGTPAAPAA